MKNDIKELLQLLGIGALWMFTIANLILGSAYFWISMLK